MALLFLPRFRVGQSTGEALAEIMGQTRIPVDTECTVVQDYGFPSWFGNHSEAILYPTWLEGKYKTKHRHEEHTI